MLLKCRCLHPSTILPAYGTYDNVGLDLYLPRKHFLGPYGRGEWGTGLAMEIPEGHVGIVVERFSVNATGVHVSGTVTSDHRGEVVLVVTNRTSTDHIFLDGHRIAQFLVVPCPRF